MGWGVRWLVWASAASMLGCVTPYGTAETALRHGRYEEAVARFEDVLARSPDRLDALLGLGVSRYKLGAFDPAVAALSRASSLAPQSGSAALYLGLSRLRQGEDELAAEHLARYVALQPGTRLAREVERASQLIRSERLSAEARAFVAASLDAGVDWERELREAHEARLATEHARRWPPMFLGVGPCFVTRTGYVFCY